MSSSTQRDVIQSVDVACLGIRGLTGRARDLNKQHCFGKLSSASDVKKIIVKKLMFLKDGSIPIKV